MSIKERRERQKQATHAGILVAARKIAREEGWPSVTIRRVAEMIEYSPPIIYEYFANKDAIISALQREGFELLAEAMRQTNCAAADPTTRLVTMGTAYWQFAQENRELYQVMHGWDSTALSMEETLTGARKVAAVLYEALEAWAVSQEMTLPDPQGAVETFWALIHGLVSIALLERLGGGPARGKELAEQAVRDLLFAWASNRS
jgi:AcrR family transcriptional regulator